MTTKNILSHASVYKITRWLDEKHSAMANLTHAQIAQFATAELGFKITDSNIAHVANILEIKVGQRNAQMSLNARSKDSPRTIARHLVYLYTKLGEPVPFDLQEIAIR